MCCYVMRSTVIHTIDIRVNDGVGQHRPSSKFLFYSFNNMNCHHPEFLQLYTGHRFHHNLDDIFG